MLSTKFYILKHKIFYQEIMTNEREAPHFVDHGSSIAPRIW
jgi:hypothetical protein